MKNLEYWIEKYNETQEKTRNIFSKISILKLRNDKYQELRVPKIYLENRRSRNRRRNFLKTKASGISEFVRLNKEQARIIKTKLQFFKEMIEKNCSPFTIDLDSFPYARKFLLSFEEKICYAIDFGPDYNPESTKDTEYVSVYIVSRYNQVTDVSHRIMVQFKNKEEVINWCTNDYRFGSYQFFIDDLNTEDVVNS
jgi:hypothetical protein